MAAGGGKIDPMHQFEVQTLWNGFDLFGHQIAFTNSALWMCITTVVLFSVLTLACAFAIIAVFP